MLSLLVLVLGAADDLRAQEAGPAADARTTVSARLAARTEQARVHVHSLVEAAPRLPGETAAAVRRVSDDIRPAGPLRAILLLIGVAALGIGAEWAFRHSLSGRPAVEAQTADTPAERLRALGLRLAVELGALAVFALGCAAMFVLFAWPLVLRQLVLGYLVALLALRLVIVLLDLVLAPPRTGRAEPAGLRALPMTDDAAVFWHRRLSLLAGVLAFGWITVQLMLRLGYALASSYLAAYAVGLCAFAICLEALWRRPGVEPPRRRTLEAVLTAYGLCLWALWVVGLRGLFSFGIIVLALPAALSLLKAGIDNVLRPTEAEQPPSLPQRLRSVLVERGLRIVLVVAAMLWLAHVFGVDLIALGSGDVVQPRILRGVMTAIVALLLADFVWQVARTAIDAKLAEDVTDSGHGATVSARQARLLTVLPILRMLLLVLIATIAGLTALSALGVDIAPLIAGAGIFGVAIGFGSQTLVRDIVSGIFYLLDDAFRVGEYIQSGNYKGTVEGFSLRSVKLRHHNGPLFTIPFGQLGAVQNQSRDWAIDKFKITVTYDTDLEKARKLIKKIGQELAEEPEFEDAIIEPLKLQGVERFADYGIELKLKMTTRPGQQHTIRRKAYLRIKQAFDEAGMKFASPTVQVAGGKEDAAAAQSAVARHGSALAGQKADEAA